MTVVNATEKQTRVIYYHLLMKKAGTFVGVAYAPQDSHRQRTNENFFRTTKENFNLDVAAIKVVFFGW